MIQLAGCAIIEGGRILLLYKTRHNYYEFPGGKIQQGESREDAAFRETMEEIGCSVQIIKYLGAYESHISEGDFETHVYQAKILSGKPQIMEPEHFSNLKWIPLDSYSQYPLAENVKKFCDEYAKGLQE